MKRTMKQVMLDKMTTHYLGKKGLSVADAKQKTDEELNLPHVMRQHIKLMDENTNTFTVAREIARIGTESTATHSPFVPYSPEQEAKVELEQVKAIVQDYIPEVAVETVVESPVVTEVETAPAPEIAGAPGPMSAPAPVSAPVTKPVYTEEELRRLIESVKPSTNYTTLLKSVQKVLDPAYDYDADLLTALAKEYAAAEKAKK